jgi:hypothetical protein
MAPAGYWEAVDSLASAYGERNRLGAMRAALLGHAAGCLAFATLCLFDWHWLTGALCMAGVTVLSTMAAAARRRMRRCERKIAILRVLVLGSAERGEGRRWTH